MGGMSTKMSDDVLAQVRQWAAAGIDLNGIQKKLQAECVLHMTYMEVRFLLLDHGIEIATEPAAEEPANEEPTSDDTLKTDDAALPGRPKVILDELQLPGALISGKVEFPGGVHGAWMIDQMGRFGWRELTGSPSPAEMQDFQEELTKLLSQG